MFSEYELDVIDQPGFDHQSEIPYETKKTFEENMGKGKALTGYPTCNLWGKEIPAIVTMTPSGTATNNIIAQVLKKLDDLVFNKWTPNGSILFILSDDHESRLHILFLEYEKKVNLKSKKKNNGINKKMESRRF